MQTLQRAARGEQVKRRLLDETFLIGALAEDWKSITRAGMSAARDTPLPAPPAPASTPLACLKQHASLAAPAIDIAAFHAFWKVRSRIHKLLVASDISGFEWRSARSSATFTTRPSAPVEGRPP